jgi:hypothetical protein
MDNKYLVMYGKYESYINLDLLKSQDVEDKLQDIKKNHKLKLMVYEAIDNTTNPSYLKMYGDLIELIEYRLQFLWGFKQDFKYHKFWNTPKCKCPRMDNEDSYPHRQYKSALCKVHS